MNAVAELSMFLVIGASMGRVRLEWGWLHSELLKPDCWPKIDQSAMAAVRLSGWEVAACEMKKLVISMVTGS